MDGKERRFLHEPYILQRIALTQVLDLLKPLARQGTSPLPSRMRERCARMAVAASALHSELIRHPDDVRREREAEDSGPPMPRRRP